MKTIFLLLINITVMSQGNYNLLKRHEDSLKIYRVYKDQIAFMEQCAQNKDYASWIKRSDRDDSLTVCEKYRLKKWNHTEYKWILQKEMEGFGEAFMYGLPDSMAPVIVYNIFSIIDGQTKFITRPDGKTIIPFIERWWFDVNCRLVKKDKINPVTHVELTIAEGTLLGKADRPPARQGHSGGASDKNNGSQYLVSTVK